MDKSQYASVDYSNVNPPQFGHKVTHAEWNPTGTFNSTLNAGDVVRFNVASADYWNPYSAYLEITVSIANNPYLADDGSQTFKTLQLDGSAHSIINSMIIYNDSDELERIQNYDVLMSMIKDMTSSVDERWGKDYEGYGGMYSASYNNSASIFRKRSQANDGALKYMSGYQPWKNTSHYFDNNLNGDLNNGSTNYITRNHAYQSTQTAFEPCFNSANITLNGTNDERCTNFNEGVTSLQGNNLNFAENNGVTQGYNPIFGNSCFEPFLSQTVKQRFMQNGFVTTGAVTELTFQIPLFSGIFGCGMHPSNFKLIPLKYFNNLIFEFGFNPHAFFTSHFSTNGAMRNYQIKKMTLHADMVQIRDPDIERNLAEDFDKGIKIPTTSWYLGPMQTVTNGAVPPTVQVNLGFSSLRSILFCFIPNDYSQNTAFRKNYRLSMGLTQLQAKIGTEYYPPLPIRGNAGNNFGPVNNYSFVRELWKSCKREFSPSSFINPHNFAINCRASDPNTADTNFTSDFCAGYFEENRVIGKAVFALTFDALNYDNKILPGINTTMSRPFELNMQYSGTKTFPRTATMFTFCHYDLVLCIDSTGIKTVGK